VPRISDLQFLVPALQGKVEFETVEDGRDEQVIERLVQGAVVAVFNRRCNLSELEPIVEAFKVGLSVDTGESLPSKDYLQMLKDVDGLGAAVDGLVPNASDAVKASAVEFLLEGLHLNKRLNKDAVSGPSAARYRG